MFLRETIFSISIFCLMFAAVFGVIENPVNKTPNYISYCENGFNENKISFMYYRKQYGTYVWRTIHDPVPGIHEPKNVTKLMITGQFTNYKQSTPMVDAYKTLNVNIIVVDWSAYSGCNHKHITDHIVPTLSRLLSRFVQLLYKAGSTPERIHLIGHSFGAHIAGLASQNLTMKVGRATGLDPGNGFYDTSPPQDRFNIDCAEFTDAIHTAAGSDGVNKSVAAADFYPNGGREQPNCANYSTEATAHFCSHATAILYFAESIHSEKGFYSLPCEMYGKQSTAEEETLMGEYISYDVRGDYCLKTNAHPPFAQGRIEN